MEMQPGFNRYDLPDGTRVFAAVWDPADVEQAGRVVGGLLAWNVDYRCIGGTGSDVFLHLPNQSGPFDGVVPPGAVVLAMPTLRMFAAMPRGSFNLAMEVEPSAPWRIHTLADGTRVSVARWSPQDVPAAVEMVIQLRRHGGHYFGMSGAGRSAVLTVNGVAVRPDEFLVTVPLLGLFAKRPADWPHGSAAVAR